MSERTRNVLLLGADYGLFLVGLAFASQATILPAFAAWLGAPNVVIGAIPAVMTLGWFLPSLFAASHTVTLAQKLPFINRWTGWERAPYLVLALFAFFVAEHAPGLTLGVLLAVLLLSTGVGGLLMPAWMDLVGRVVPTATRGRFFALASLAAGVLSFAASFMVADVLARVPAPASYGYCFLAAFVFLGLSWIGLLLVREPEGAPAAAPIGLAAYLARVPGLLQRDRNLSWFLAARGLAMIGSMAGGFYTVHALRAWDAPAAKAGVFTALIVAGHAVGTLTLGWLADHVGHRPVLMVGTAAIAAANVVALTAPTLSVYEMIFLLVGLQQAAMNVSAMNVLLEFAPTAAERPTYIGLGTTSLAPVAFSAPLVGGLLADAVGFRSVFVVALVAGLLGLTVLAALVRDPRSMAAARAIEEATA